MIEPATPLQALLEQHPRLEALFTEHLCALVVQQPAQALAHLAAFSSVLAAHLQAEETQVLPVYAERGAGQVEVHPEVFAAEHRKMLSLLEALRVRLHGLVSDSSPVQVIAYLDQALTFRRLLEHHDRREEAVLYPWFERLLGAAGPFDGVARSD